MIKTARVSVTKGVHTVAVALTAMDCVSCSVIFAIPDDYDDRRREDGKSFYCPNGHSMSYGESAAEKLKRQLKNVQSTADWERRHREAAENRLRATKGVVTKLRKRALEGECPFCGQHLRDLERHVARQHPNEQAETE